MCCTFCLIVEVLLDGDWLVGLVNDPCEMLTGERKGTCD